jgi:hypothetical protein
MRLTTHILFSKQNSQQLQHPLTHADHRLRAKPRGPHTCFPSTVCYIPSILLRVADALSSHRHQEYPTLLGAQQIFQGCSSLLLLLLLLPLLPPAGNLAAILLSMRSTMRALLPLAVLLLGLQLAAAGRQSRSLLNTPKQQQTIPLTQNQFVQVGGPHSMLRIRHADMMVVCTRVKAALCCSSLCCSSWFCSSCEAGRKHSVHGAGVRSYMCCYDASVCYSSALQIAARCCVHAGCPCHLPCAAACRQRLL